MSGPVISHPGQCCDGWCIEDLSLHHLAHEDAERVVAAINAAVARFKAEAVAAIEADAEVEFAATGRSFHPQGTHSDGRRDGLRAGRMSAANLLRRLDP